MAYYRGVISIGVIILLSSPVYAQTEESGVKIARITNAAPNMPASSPTLSITNNSYNNPPAYWSQEDQYWRQHYPATSYYSANTDYSVYEPAYEYGVNAFGLYNGKRWEDIDQLKLSSGWEKARGTSTLTWDQAQNAARDAYMRMYNKHNSNGAAGAVGR